MVIVNGLDRPDRAAAAGLVGERPGPGAAGRPDRRARRERRGRGLPRVQDAGPRRIHDGERRGLRPVRSSSAGRSTSRPSAERSPELEVLREGPREAHLDRDRRRPRGCRRAASRCRTVPWLRVLSSSSAVQVHEARLRERRPGPRTRCVPSREGVQSPAPGPSRRRARGRAPRALGEARASRRTARSSGHDHGGLAPVHGLVPGVGARRRELDRPFAEREVPARTPSPTCRPTATASPSSGRIGVSCPMPGDPEPLGLGRRPRGAQSNPPADSDPAVRRDLDLAPAGPAWRAPRPRSASRSSPRP